MQLQSITKYADIFNKKQQKKLHQHLFLLI